MEVDELVGIDVDRFWTLQLEEFPQRKEVDVVGGIYGLRRAEDVVRDWDSAAQSGKVFDIVDAGPRSITM